ncbi:hypothetical protein [Aquihabitans sp. McL0605]|uniref:hypothetical protein n=1 Tax=Aquihabitans sp. McL0605 TaxID=3415671 RepID=UPI003CF18113
MNEEPAADEPAPRTATRRTIITGVAAALAGAGAGAAAVALSSDDAEAAPRIAAGSVAGGDGGPWHYVAPGGSIQDTIDAGARAIQLGDGSYPVDRPLVPTPGCTIRGIGERTVVVATTSMAAVVAVGAGGPIGGVTLAELVVDAAKKAVTGIDIDIVGTSGNLRGEPDAACRFDDLWVLDPVQDGIVYRGTDTQACTTTRTRVRRAGRHGYRIEAPDNTWIACEATTSGTGGAGFYVGVAIDGSDGIGAANLHFHACKAWYCRGYGWHIATGRNSFVGCEAQDTAGHGWLISAARNTFSGCIADTAGMADVGGTAATADGFHVVPGAELSLTGCLAFDREPGGLPAQQRYGFNVPKALVDDGLLVAPTGWGNVDGLINERR